MVARDLKSMVGEVLSFFLHPARRADESWTGETRAPSGRTENKVEQHAISRDSKSLATNVRPPGETAPSPSKTRGRFCTGSSHAARISLVLAKSLFRENCTCDYGLEGAGTGGSGTGAGSLGWRLSIVILR